MIEPEKEYDLPVIIIGAGGHACVVADVLTVSGCNVLGFTDCRIAEGTDILGGLCVLGNDDILSQYKVNSVAVAIGVGFLPDNNVRTEIFQRIRKLGYIIKSIQHSFSVVGAQVALNEGAQIMAGAVVQPRAIIGKNVIVNTGVKIDHDSVIGDHSHIAPGATVCGNVIIGKNCFIGTGATIVHGINIGDNAVIAAGVTVRNDILSNQIFTGV